MLQLLTTAANLAGRLIPGFMAELLDNPRFVRVALKDVETIRGEDSPQKPGDA